MEHLTDFIYEAETALRLLGNEESEPFGKLELSSELRLRSKAIRAIEQPPFGLRNLQSLSGRIQ